MIVRIRLLRGRTVQKRNGKGRRLALAFASLLTPSSVMACALAVWRLGADLQWTGQFAISRGIFSHWQVWMGLAGALQLAAAALNRYGRSSQTASGALHERMF